VHPSFNTQYELRLWWGPRDDQRAFADQEVAVNLPLENPRLCTKLLALGLHCRHKVTIDANNLGPLLSQALGTPDTTVTVVKDVNMSWTGVPSSRRG
jgi:hypothetical protein